MSFSRFEFYASGKLPEYLQKSLDKMIAAEEERKKGKEVSLYDCIYCELQSDINCAETDLEISSEKAWELRNKYLGIYKEEEIT